MAVVAQAGGAEEHGVLGCGAEDPARSLRGPFVFFRLAGLQLRGGECGFLAGGERVWVGGLPGEGREGPRVDWDCGAEVLQGLEDERYGLCGALVGGEEEWVEDLGVSPA